jgi:outer membrane protein OmpA-like peptidoglycan-associated protein
MKTLCTLFALLWLLASGGAHADAQEPVADYPGSRDLPWLQRFDGSWIVAYRQIAYDEYLFPAGPLKRVADPDAADESNNNVYEFEVSEKLEGARTRLVYLLPAGRSPLEALRGYEQTLVADGAVKNFECSAAACGGSASRSSAGGGGEQSVAMKLWPASRVTDESFSNAHCAQVMAINDQRFASFTLPEKARVLVHAFTGANDLYCEAFGDRVIVIVDVLELKPREQKMVTVSAAEMSASMANTGRVALYGILFDTASSVIKPESRPALEQIAALLAQSPALRVHVVGHTDNQGTLEGNFALSRARAQAVSAALIADFGIEASRLNANGVSSLAPVASNADEAGRARNRRVELVPF